MATWQLTNKGFALDLAHSIDYWQFNTSFADAQVEGRLQWNSEDGTLEYGLPGGNVTLQIGQEQLLKCANNTGSTITDGQVVYISGASGSRPEISLATSAEGTGKVPIGMATESIDHQAQGYVNVGGLVRGIDTSDISAGGIGFLSDTIPGALRATPPDAPNYTTVVGYCLFSSEEDGIFFVHVLSAPRMQSLSDVDHTSPSADGQLYVWDETTDKRFELGDHGDIGGLGDDDHTQYVLVDGTRAMTGSLVLNHNNAKIELIDDGAAQTDIIQGNVDFSIYIDSLNAIVDSRMVVAIDGNWRFMVTPTGIQVGNQVVSESDLTDLLDGGASTAHKHDHGGMDGLGGDDHTQYILHSLAGGVNDFIVASGEGTFVKKTLAETGAILEGDIEHDNLQGVTAAEHVDWAGVEAGTIHTTNYIEGGPGKDTTAIHDNVANEISAIDEKAVPVAGDMLIIEDSEASYIKKMIQIGNLPGGGGGEINTASSAGAGVSLYYQKTVADLEFNAIKSETNAIDISLDAGTHDIEVTLVEMYIDHGGLGGLDDDDHTQYIRHNLGDNDNDFLLNQEGAFIPKTLAQVGALLEGDMQHDNLQGVTAAEHIDWEGAAAGTIHIDNYIEGGAGTDTTAIHDNVDGEISAIAEKEVPVAGDMIVIEDSEASNAKKMVQLDNLPGGGGGVDTSGSPEALDYARFTDADTIEGREYSEVRGDLGLVIGTNVLAEQTIGIADDNLVEMDDADAANLDYCRLTTVGIEGRSYAEVLGDIQGMGLAGGTFTGAVEPADHGTATNPEIVAVVYGTGSAPTANTTPIGSLWVKYTA